MGRYEVFNADFFAPFDSQFALIIDMTRRVLTLATAHRPSAAFALLVTLLVELLAMKIYGIIKLDIG